MSLDPLLVMSTSTARIVPITADSNAVKKAKIKVFTIISPTGTRAKIEKADLKLTPRRANAPKKGISPKAVIYTR